MHGSALSRAALGQLVAVPEDGAVALGEVSELDMGLDMRYASIQ